MGKMNSIMKVILSNPVTLSSTSTLKGTSTLAGTSGHRHPVGHKQVRRRVLYPILLIITFIFLSANFCLAAPEVLTLKSPLVWLKDNTGDYLLGELLSPGIYEVSQAHTTEGEIEAIFASWKFKGKVTLEVSADDGIHYTPIINGQPLTSGFIKGNRIKSRATLAEDSQLIELKISYIDTSGVIGTFGEPELSGFEFRKSILINNPTDEDLFNYQLRIKIAESSQADSYDVHCDENIKADFKDVRFTTSDGQTLLSHYLENIEGTSPNRVAIFWVKIPQISVQGAPLYIYYHNPQAEDISSADDVFDFYDDFDEADLDLEKWELKEGTYVVSGSRIRLIGAEIFSKEYRIKDGIIEFRAKSELGNEVRLIARAEKDGLLNLSGQVAYSSGYEGIEHCLAVGDIIKVNQTEPITPGTTTYDYRVILEDTKLTFQRYSEGYQQLQAEVTYDDVGGLARGSIGLKVASGRTNYFDSLRVRQHSLYDIKVDAAAQTSQAESVILPVFEDVKLDNKGNLALKDNHNKGDYKSSILPLAFYTRIFIPSYSGLDSEEGEVKLDVSMDGGGNFANDCLRGKFYYASKREFILGDEAQFRLELLREKEKTAQVEEVTIDYRAGNILVISPNGKEAWKPRTTKEITWTALGYEQTYKMKIEYSLDKGKSYITIIESTENTGSYLWDIPDDAISDDALIKVSDAYNSKVFDTSDLPFSISTKEVTPEEEEELLLTEKEADKALKKLIKRSRPRGTQAYDVVVKLGDNVHQDSEEDSRASFKHGDVVVVRPTGHNWSETERNSFLIIQMYLTDKEARALPLPRRIDTGKVDEDGRPIKKVIRKRANRINLYKLGLSGKKRPDIKKKHSVENTLKDKTLKPELIEEK